MDLWNDDQPISDRFDGIDVPAWIECDDAFISPRDVAAIVQGGCASGAYMPAVTYHQAAETMAKHGDDVLDFIAGRLGELPMPSSDVSWPGMACHFLSIAVELWASEAASILESSDGPEEEEETTCDHHEVDRMIFADCEKCTNCGAWRENRQAITSEPAGEWQPAPEGWLPMTDR